MHIGLSFAGILILVASPPWFAPPQQTSETGALMTDRDKAQLRGPVKTLVEQSTFSGPGGQESTTTTTTEYTPDGRILENRTKNSDGSEWGTSYTYRPDGRLLKTADANGNSKPSSETTYLYDEAGRLVGMSSGDKILVRYTYDDKGRKSATENFDTTPLPPNTAYGTHWEGTDLGFANYLGGTLTTSYNEQGVATGAEFRDPEGKLVGHIVRKFDPQGRIISEEQFSDAPREVPLPEAMRSMLNPEQMKSVNALIAGMQNRANSYSYDDQGRLKERHRTGGPFGEETTITSYNDHGDKASERTTTVVSPLAGQPFTFTEAGAMIPSGPPATAQPPTVYEIQYTYQYDPYGNWTEQTNVSHSLTDAWTGPATTQRRKLAYY